MYPNCIRYTHEHSAVKSANTDIAISFKEKVIGQTRGNLTVGNEILVLSRDKEQRQIIVFGAIITDKLDELPTCWAEKGGKFWKNNWSIRPITSIKVLTEDEIQQIIGQKPNWHIANSSFMGSGKNIQQIGIPRKKILDYLQNNT